MQGKPMEIHELMDEPMEIDEPMEVDDHFWNRTNEKRDENKRFKDDFVHFDNHDTLQNVSCGVVGSKNYQTRRHVECD